MKHILLSIPILKVTSPIVINLPTRDLLAVETKNVFVLWLAKFKFINREVTYWCMVLDMFDLEFHFYGYYWLV